MCKIVVKIICVCKGELWRYRNRPYNTAWVWCPISTVHWVTSDTIEQCQKETGFTFHFANIVHSCLQIRVIHFPWTLCFLQNLQNPNDNKKQQTPNSYTSTTIITISSNKKNTHHHPIIKKSSSSPVQVAPANVIVSGMLGASQSSTTGEPPVAR